MDIDLFRRKAPAVVPATSTSTSTSTSSTKASKRSKRTTTTTTTDSDSSNTEPATLSIKISSKSRDAPPPSPSSSTSSSSTSSTSSSSSSSSSDWVIEQRIQDECDSDTIEAAETSFEDLGLHHWLIQCCKSLGFVHPTPVQRACIPPIMRGMNAIGAAETGSGKTAAFALPILHALAIEPYGPFALVLTPTRELAMQIAEQFLVLGAPLSVRVAVIIGGLDMMKQAAELERKPHVIIATPGRLQDHLRSASAPGLHRLRFLVLDEADRLLESSGFRAEVSEIIAHLPTERQTLLFSATISNSIREMLTFSSPPFCYRSRSRIFPTVAALEQFYLMMPSHVKECYLVYLLRKLSESSTIVFTSTCRSCAVLQLMLKELEIPAVALHSQLSQMDRIKALGRFKSRYVQVLVATDVASRGLDIPWVEAVINFDVPTAAADYVHRVGRTARAGKSGLALTLVTQYDIELVHTIESTIARNMVEYDVNEEDVLKHLMESTAAKKVAQLEMERSGFEEKAQQRKQENFERKKRERAAQASSSDDAAAASSAKPKPKPKRARSEEVASEPHSKKHKPKA